MGNGRTFTESQRDSSGRVMAVSDLCNDGGRILADDFGLAAVEILLDEGTGQVALPGSLVEVGLGQAPFGRDLCKDAGPFGGCPGLPGLCLQEHDSRYVCTY